MMHSSTRKEVKIFRRVIEAYHSPSDEYARSLPVYYKALGDSIGHPIALDETGEVKLHLMKALLNQLGLNIKSYTWIGGRVILDITINQAK